MVRFLFLSCFLVAFLFNTQAEEGVVTDSIKANKMYLVWNDNSSLRDSLQMKRVISYYQESRYVDECVENGQVKHLLSVERLSRFKKGNESQFMFLFNDPHFSPGETRTVAAISFQGDEALPDLVNEVRYITLNTKFTPLINTDFMPSFNGGYNAMMKYLNEKVNLSGNTDVTESCGAVVLGFMVNKDGSIRDLKILENCNDILDREAYRLVQSMPKWQSGKRAGDSVAVFVVLQLIFRP